MDNPPKRKHIDWAARTVRIELFILLLGCALILAAVSLYLGFSSTANQEYSNYVDSSKFQSVHINAGTGSATGTIEFIGHITKITDKYYILENIYYPASTSSTTGQAGSTQLVKLGCQQADAPYDMMVINRSQVAFWENLQDSGKIVQAIKKYQQGNPNGPNCSAGSTSTGSSSSSSSSSSGGSTSSNKTSGNTTY